MKTEQGQQYHQHAIAMAIRCLAPEDRSEPDTGNALSWLRSIEWVASPQEPHGDALLTPEQRADIVAAGNRGMPNQAQKTIMSMESGQTPGKSEPDGARMCMEAPRLDSGWYPKGSDPEQNLLYVSEITEDWVCLHHSWAGGAPARVTIQQLHEFYTPLIQYPDSGL